MVLGSPVYADNGNFELSLGTVLTSEFIVRLQGFGISPIRVFDDPEVTAIIKDADLGDDSKLVRKFIPSGKYLYLHGDIGEKVYLLLSGELDMIYVHPDKLPTKLYTWEKLRIIMAKGRRISSIIKPNSVFGELGPLLSKPRLVSVKATENCLVALIPADTTELHQTMLLYPGFGLSVAIGLARQMQDRIRKISKYNTLIQRLEPVVKEFPLIYLTIAEKLKNRVIQTKSENLELLHEQMKHSSLYSRTSRFQKEGTVLRDFFPHSAPSFKRFNHEIFKGFEIKDVPEGSVICEPGSPANKIYVLRSGAVGIYQDRKALIKYRRKGDTLGTVSALLGYGSKNKTFEKRKLKIKTITRCRYIEIDARYMKDSASENPDLILHISRGLADRLANTNSELLESLTNIEKFVGRLRYGDSSMLGEIGTTLDLCHGDPLTQEFCKDEIETLERMRETLETIEVNIEEILSSTHMGATYYPH